jgi:hypothetical protein
MVVASSGCFPWPIGRIRILPIFGPGASRKIVLLKLCVARDQVADQLLQRHTVFGQPVPRPLAEYAAAATGVSGYPLREPQRVREVWPDGWWYASYTG